MENITRFNDRVLMDMRFLPKAKTTTIKENIERFFNWLASLSRYEKIYLLSNAKDIVFDPACLRKNDMVILFNRHQYEFARNAICDVTVFHRQIGERQQFHGGHSGFDKSANYIAISDFYYQVNTLDVAFLKPYNGLICSDFIPYSSDNKKVPSTGFVLLYLLHHYFNHKPLFDRIHPIGFEFTGWQGHDWKHEQAHFRACGWNLLKVNKGIR